MHVVALLVLVAMAVPALSEQVGLGDPQFNDGLLTKHRPPIQVKDQSDVMNGVKSTAKKLSDDSKQKMITDVLVAAQKSCPQLKDMSGDQLFDWFLWEFQRLPIIHNGPIVDNGDSPYPLDDTDVFTTLKNGYVQNIIQRYVLGRESKNDYFGQNGIMEHYLGYKPFSNDNSPTLSESDQRPLYCANNWDKKHCGNYEYGQVTYVINPTYADKYFFLPFDSGKYAKTRTDTYCNNGKICKGTSDNFAHVVRQHKATYGDYDLAPIFNRWYDPTNYPPQPIADLKYFEIEFSANAWLPEALLYITVKYYDIFSTDNGRWIQDWMKRNKRPLIWADNDTSGMLLDPYVGKRYLP
jgi:hypothetical protein